MILGNLTHMAEDSSVHDTIPEEDKVTHFLSRSNDPFQFQVEELHVLFLDLNVGNEVLIDLQFHKKFGHTVIFKEGGFDLCSQPCFVRVENAF